MWQMKPWTFRLGWLQDEAGKLYGQFTCLGGQTWCTVYRPGIPWCHVNACDTHRTGWCNNSSPKKKVAVPCQAQIRVTWLAANFWQADLARDGALPVSHFLQISAWQAGAPLNPEGALGKRDRFTGSPTHFAIQRFQFCQVLQSSCKWSVKHLDQESTCSMKRAAFLFSVLGLFFCQNQRFNFTFVLKFRDRQWNRETTLLSRPSACR